MGLVPVIKPGNWKSVQDAIRKLSTIRLGSTAIPTFASIRLDDLTASRLVATGTNKQFESSDLYGWVTQASANQVIVTDDNDGTITLSLPQDYDTGATPTLAGLTIVNAITEFSTDGTMGGDSDSAVPTEKAVKAYIDSAAGGLLDHSLLANLDYASAGHTGFQELDATLTSIAALGTAGDKLAYTTGVDTWAEASLTVFARTILDDVNAGAVATTIGLGIGNNVTFARVTVDNIVLNLNEITFTGESVLNCNNDLILRADQELRFQPSGDTDDYIRFTTLGNVPHIDTAGSCNLHIHAGGGTVDFDDETLSGTGNLSFVNGTFTGDIFCDELILTIGDNYKFSQRDTHSLTLQNQVAGQYSATEFFSADGDGSDNVFFTLWLIGTPDNVANGEYFQMKASNDNIMKILSGAIGGGTGRPIEMATYSGIIWNDNQLYLDTDGQVGIGKVPTTVLDVNGSFNVTGAATIGDGGTANYALISATGDLKFVGTAGLVFGSCYGNHIGWSQAAAVQNTWYNIADADMISGPLNNVTHDGNGKLTVTEPGMYLINYSCCFEDTVANDHIEVGIEVSGSGSADNAGQCHLENKFASEEEHASSSCILDLADNATIEVAIRTTDAGTPTISVQAINLTAVQIGGT